MFKPVLSFSLAGLISGCVSTSLDSTMAEISNKVTFSNSEFDQSNSVRVSRISCDDVAFELYKDTSESFKDVVMLRAGYRNNIKNIAKGNALKIKLDGTLFEFFSDDFSTQFSEDHLGYGVKITHSFKNFIVPEEFVRSAAEADRFLVKVSLLEGTFIEGKCSSYSLEDMKSRGRKYGYEKDLTQEDVDRGNKHRGQVGFQKFVSAIDDLKS